jgi:hypothetical protein
MTRLAAPLGLVLGMGIAAALGPGLAEVIHHGGWNPFDEEGRAIAADGGTAALVSDGAPSGLHPPGFDPTIAGDSK